MTALLFNATAKRLARLNRIETNSAALTVCGRTQVADGQYFQGREFVLPSSEANPLGRHFDLCGETP